MPSRFVPSKSSAHRLACLSLYKALLRRCGEFLSRSAAGSNPNSKSPSATLKALVRYRFKHDKKIKNWQQIRNTLQFGRGALQVLDAAALGSSKALQEMTRVLSASTNLAERNKQALQQLREECHQSKRSEKLKEGKIRETKLANPASYQRKPTTIPVLERPLPYDKAPKHSDGRRRVPDFFVVQGIPFLRYSRPQPLHLSLFIRNQILKHEKLWNGRGDTEQLIQMANLEDNWDAHLQRAHRLERHDSQTWQSTYRDALRELQIRTSKLDAKRLEAGKNLWNVYLEEEKLAEAENAKRKQERKKLWNEQHT